MKRLFEMKFLVTAAACLFAISALSGCANELLVESVSGSGQIVSDDGTVTEFEIETSVIIEEGVDGVPCTNLIQQGMATFSDCEADIHATVLLSPGDEADILACFESGVITDFVDPEDPDVLNFTECFEDGFNDNLFSGSFITGRYELRSCQAQECDYFFFVYFPYFNAAYFYEIPSDGQCFEGLEEGFNIFGSCGWHFLKHFFGVYCDVDENKDEITGTGCLFAFIVDEVGVDFNGDPAEENDRIAVILIDDDGTVAYSNCGNAGSSITTTLLSDNDFPDGLDICDDQVFGLAGDRIFFGPVDPDAIFLGDGENLFFLDPVIPDDAGAADAGATTTGDEPSVDDAEEAADETADDVGVEAP